MDMYIKNILFCIYVHHYFRLKTSTSNWHWQFSCFFFYRCLLKLAMKTTTRRLLWSRFTTRACLRIRQRAWRWCGWRRRTSTFTPTLSRSESLLEMQKASSPSTTVSAICSLFFLWKKCRTQAGRRRLTIQSWIKDRAAETSLIDFLRGY